MKTFPPTKPYTLNGEEGQRLHSLGTSISVKATSEQTNSVFNLFEVSCPTGFTTPLHIHYCEDVVIYVLAGTLSFFCGDDKKEAVPGSFFFQPRGTPHGFRVEGEVQAQILYITIPAGFDDFVFEQGLLAPRSTSEIIAARHKIEILGPLPG